MQGPRAGYPQARRHRRSSLLERMGTRLQARLQGAEQPQDNVPWDQHYGTDSDSYSEGRSRHPACAADQGLLHIPAELQQGEPQVGMVRRKFIAWSGSIALWVRSLHSQLMFQVHSSTLDQAFLAVSPGPNVLAYGYIPILWTVTTALNLQVQRQEKTESQGHGRHRRYYPGL